MNIIVRPYGTAGCYCRPDTTWEREDKDLFSPEFAIGYMFTPVLFVRICKAGKFIGQKFASRYYDSVGYGALLYEKGMLDGSPLGYACASCMDHTSILPFPMYNRVTLEEGTNIFSIKKNGKELFSTTEGSQALIEESLAEISRFVSLRIGDIAAIELDAPKEIADKDEGKAEIHGTFCGNDLFRFNIIL